MELRQLRSFNAVASEGTYAAAAAALSLTQPAVWRQVRDLEQELGLPLFERHGRRVRLTADGMRLVEESAAVLARLDRLAATAADLRSVRGGVVGIACASPHLQRFLASTISVFREEHPEVSLVIREYSGATLPGRGIREDLLEGVVDLATLVATAGDPEFDGFPIYDVRLVVAVPDNHEWRDRPTIPVKALEGRPLIVSHRGTYSRGVIDAACRRAGFEPSVAFTVASPPSQVALGRADLGLPIVVDDAVAPEGDRPWPRLVENGRPISETVRLLWRTGAKLSPSVRAFVGIARAMNAEGGQADARRGAGRRGDRGATGSRSRAATAGRRTLAKKR